VNTRLVAATPQEQERLAEIAGGFSEDDLTRYLQITLDVFKDLQASLQPRLHLEIGLLKLIQAGRLTSIEEALAGLERPAAAQPVRATASAAGAPTPISRAAASERPAPAPKPAAPAAPPKAAQATPTAEPKPQPTGDLRTRLHAALMELGLQFTADTVADSQITEENGILRFIIPDDCLLDANDIQKALQAIGMRPMRVSVATGAPQPAARIESAQRTGAAEDEAAERALSHPAVKAFRDKFPDAHVRTVRNLKE
jgi:DNA polymerase-3 subunit gamma/tau